MNDLIKNIITEWGITPSCYCHIVVILWNLISQTCWRYAYRVHLLSQSHFACQPKKADVIVILPLFVIWVNQNILHSIFSSIFCWMRSNYYEKFWRLTGKEKSLLVNFTLIELFISETETFGRSHPEASTPERAGQISHPFKVWE